MRGSRASMAAWGVIPRGRSPKNMMMVLNWYCAGVGGGGEWLLVALMTLNNVSDDIEIDITCTTAEMLIKKTRSSLSRQASTCANNIAPFIRATSDAAGNLGYFTVLYTWFGLLFAGTVSDNKYFSAFNIKANFRELVSPKASKMTIVDYIRVMAILWVMVNHLGSEGRIDILERAPSAKAFKNAIHDHTFFGPVFGNSALGVEVFLVLSGLLAARSWSRVATTESGSFRSKYFGFLLKRAFRLFPSVAVFIYFAQSSLSSTYLPRFHDTMLSSCGVKGLASHLTFTSNLQSTPTCLGYLWYLGLDFQLYALSPLLMMALMYNAKFGIFIVSACVTISMVLRGVMCRAYGICNNSDVDIPFISFPNQTESDLEAMYGGIWDMYSRPQTKCGPYFIGVFVGWLTTVISTTPKLSEKTLKVVNYAAIAGALFCVFGILPEYWNPHAGDTLYNTFYTAIFRTLFGACVSWLIMYCTYWHNAQFSIVFNVLATITFQAYLLHMPVVYLFNHVPYLQTATGPWEVLTMLPFVAILSYFAAFLMYLLVEAPMAKVATYVYQVIKQNYLSTDAPVAKKIN
uniref:Acyl_transf_3 domain-containing protein n=1 Tax=Panagrellus redivivus TaxID=6233 RepID=A0A7E4ZWB9_PANRE